MKRLLLSLILISCYAVTFAQSGGPDTYGYVWRDNTHPSGPAYNWVDITGMPGATQVTGLADDNTSQTYQMGFQFPYYWYTVNDFKVGSNGYIIFNNGALSSPFPTIPLQSLPNDFVGAFMADLNFQGTGNTAQCWYWSNNVDTLIVSYIDVPFWINNVTTPYTGLNTFQIILSAVDSSITFNYKTQTGTSTGTGTFLSIGIENISGAIGLQHSINIYPIDSTSIKFYYPPTTAFIVNDAVTVYGDNMESGGLFLSNNGNPYTMTSRIGNAGNQTLDTIPITMQIINSGGTSLVQDYDTAFSLAPQATQDFTAPSTFAPTVVDIYSFRTTTSLPGDFTATNDVKNVKLTVVDTTQILIPLTYAPNNVPVGDGISWTGGNAGVGVEIAPPFYPCYVHYMEFFISVNPQPSPFAGLLFDDDGPNGGPGTLIDSLYIPANDVLVGAWNRMVLNTPYLMDSGSVFVEWLMAGDGIQIGTDSTHPVSNRSYEVLGGWSILRYRENQDPMIMIQVSASAINGVPAIKQGEFVGNFYPSPASDKISIDINGDVPSKDLKFDFYDVRGQLIDSRTLGAGRSKFTFDVSGYPSGVYLCKITAGEQQINRKVIITK